MLNNLNTSYGVESFYLERIIRNVTEPEGTCMIARWISVLDTYDSDIQHRKGSLHVNAGAESPDEDVIKKTAHVSFNVVRSTKSGKKKKQQKSGLPLTG